MTTTIAQCPASERVKRLRERARTRHVYGTYERKLWETRSWRETAGELWWIVRKGKKVAAVLSHMTPALDPDELLVGRYPAHAPTEAEQAELAEADQVWAWQPRVCGQTGHMAIDYEKLLRLGVRGIMAEIEQYRAQLDIARPTDQEKDAFYRAALEALEAVCVLAQRYAARARELAAEATDQAQRAELEELARICRHVPAQPAQTYHEALQSVHFVTFCIMASEPANLFCPGRMDRWLYPYYRRDLREGRLTPERAQELLDCFFILINENVAPGLAVGVMIGGQDGHGNDVTNELSYMCLQAKENTRLAYPTVGLCYHPGTPEELLRRGCELLALGTGDPAIFNDQVISEGLRRAGLSREESYLYINSTCVEISPIASSNIWVASPYFNLTQTLLDIISDIAEGKLPQPSRIEDLLAEHKRRMAQQIARAVAEQNSCREARRRFGGYPLLSCFVNDCLHRGKDLDAGGARHNWIECSFVGLANLVDSLAAIARLVFEEQAVTLQRLWEVLESDFAEAESLRQRLLNDAPKYGNDDDTVDALAVEITEFLAAECAKHEVVHNDRYYPGFFCWVMHGRLGAQTGASPDGRRAGWAFADGAGPAQGRELCGPTAAVKSTTKWDHTPNLGGLVLNLKFSARALDTAEAREKLAALIRTYMQLGGLETQINVVSRDTLLDAQENPEQHRDLLVRVAGYSDYFVGLDPVLQDEIIRRTEHEAV